MAAKVVTLFTNGVSGDFIIFTPTPTPDTIIGTVFFKGEWGKNPRARILVVATLGGEAFPIGTITGRIEPAFNLNLTTDSMLFQIIEGDGTEDLTVVMGYNGL